LDLRLDLPVQKVIDAAVLRDQPLRWHDIAKVARGAHLELSQKANDRVAYARALVEAIIARGTPVYGVNTGVGALVNHAVPRALQQQLSRNLILSHACGVGTPLEPVQVRAIMAAKINDLAHGHSGVRPALVAALAKLLAGNCIPVVPKGGSVGYLTHMAHISLVLLGLGRAHHGDASIPGAQALQGIGASPLVLDAKEGLSLINGSACATGLACVALDRIQTLITSADVIAALTFEALGGQMAAFAEAALNLRVSPGLQTTGAALRALLQGSEHLAAMAGHHLQDALSLRAIPHVHGALRDQFDHTATILDQELASVTDNPVLTGTIAEPQAHSEAHAVAPGLALSLDAIAMAIAQLGLMSERRIDRLINPELNAMPAFLASDPGVTSGYMIAQYTACSLVNDNRRLAAPASLDGGITSALQEDMLVHPTPAALKLLAIVENVETILSIELIAAAEAQDIAVSPDKRAAGTGLAHAQIRKHIPRYRDDQPLNTLFALGVSLLPEMASIPRA
jgi:histidine ammonia-lyase